MASDFKETWRWILPRWQPMHTLAKAVTSLCKPGQQSDERCVEWRRRTVGILVAEVGGNLRLRRRRRGGDLDASVVEPEP
jgi:hypothetical protein